MTNKYKGKCSECGKPVYPGDGLVERVGEGWATMHVECAIGAAAEVSDDLFHSDAYERDGAAFEAKEAKRAKALAAWREATHVEGSDRLESYYDTSDYIVPANGLTAEDVRSALYDAWHTSLTGWSVGGYTTPNVKDNGDGTLTVTTVYHIGD